MSVQITIRDISNSDAIETIIRKRVDKLKQFYNRIISCRVVVDLVQKHKHQGKLYNVRIDLSLPGKELTVTKKQDEDFFIAIREAFHAMERQLEEHARKRHGRVKTHNGVLHGHVSRLLLEEGYGFIQGTDGNEYYFSLTNVHYPKFSQLTVGDAVEYIAEVLNEGWQAQRVVKERNHHLNHA